MLADVTNGFSRDFARHVVTIDKDLGHVSTNELPRHLTPAVARWERLHHAEVVESLLGNSSRTVVGMDETLAQLQRGRIRRLVLAGDMDAKLRRCRRCGMADRAADQVCQRCGGERELVTVGEAALELAWKQNTEIEIVSGVAGERLEGAEGIGGWLRQASKAPARA
jgi:peptide subunit release factor 1 (eRF1)